jgi:6-phosphogluconolactonase (cycloisomerase 2 family)
MAGPIYAAVHPSADMLYVVNNNQGGSGSVSMISFNSNGVLTQLTGSPVNVGQDPVSISFDWSGKFAYVVNRGSKTISSFVVQAGTGLLTPNPNQVNTVYTGSYPMGAAMATPGYNYLMEAPSISGVQGVYLYGVNSATGNILPLSSEQGNFFPTNTTPSGVAVDPTTRYLYGVARGQADGGAVLNGTTYVPAVDPGSMESQFYPTVGSPYPGNSSFNAMYYHPGGAWAYGYFNTQNYGGGPDPNAIDIFKADPSTGAMTYSSSYSFGFPIISIVIDPSGNNMYVLERLPDLPCTGGGGGPGGGPPCQAGQVAWFTINQGTGAITYAGHSYNTAVIPAFMGIDSSGSHLFITNKFNTSKLVAYMSIFAITPQGSANAGSLTEVSGSPFALGTGSAAYVISEVVYNLSVHPSGQFQYVVDQQGGCVYSYSYSSGGVLSNTGKYCPPSPGSAQLSVIDPTGRWLIVYYTSGGNYYLMTYLINGITGQLWQVPTYPSCPTCANTPMQILYPVGSMTSFYTVSGGHP